MPPTSQKPLTYAVDASFRTDVGCSRELNEDAATIIHPDEQELLVSKGTLAVIADGMGGHSAGEVASRIAVDIVGHSYYQSSKAPQEALVDAVIEANTAIHDAAKQNGGLKGMGTTCTALALQNQSAIHAQVGDSRLYLVRGGSAYQLSEDHSLVMQMVKDGVISLEEARSHPDRNVIIRALGRQAKVEVASWEKPLPVKPDDRFVLCSDGLYGVVEDDEIAKTVASVASTSACDRLVKMANDRGGPDNISVCVLIVGESGAKRATTSKE